MNDFLNAGAQMLDEMLPTLCQPKRIFGGTARLTYELPTAEERNAPTERQLEWMRDKIPGFATAERQARAARGRQG